MRGLTISQLAKESQVTVETIKFYEKKGLLTKPPRTESGYRMFPESTAADMAFIKRAQEMGFTLQEIRHLLTMVRQEDYYPTEEMHAFAALKVEELERQIRRMQSFKELLEQIARRPYAAPPLPRQECPLLARLLKE
ncbi:MerR family transcriptional regulator [Paenibacillus mucilaginosus 3016]|uniref:MerR family transcriptional regulator n=1 Tax=Paenibacillus mucilaginosus 3016 TaxID=1116391 RepID=H6NK50_9BACL|nr:MerR family transcriptional regulator [Paenibacillus mucilaginosus]AFC30903.1 MerR family transcriptional regulator [Paenibacillus mucilaginosus 3016]WFA19505.1 MerR family transcriptional regulator [Paenibacillus mucilaginosus]